MKQNTTNTNQTEVYQSHFVKLAEESWREDGTFKPVIPLEFTNAMNKEIARRHEAAALYMVRALDRDFSDLMEECAHDDTITDWDDRPSTKALMSLYALRDALILTNEYCCEAISRFTAVDRALDQIMQSQPPTADEGEGKATANHINDIAMSMMQEAARQGGGNNIMDNQ